MFPSNVLVGFARAAAGLLVLAIWAGFAAPMARAEAAVKPLAMVIMDPLAKELACACVKGYAQRDYPKLAAYLATELGQPTTFLFAEDLAGALAKLAPNQEILVIGKHSVVTHDAGPAGFKCQPLCRLTAQDGRVTLTGFFVVKASDKAAKLGDLAGRKFFLGSPNADEKNAAALAALRAAGITPPDPCETRATCAGAALDVVDSSLEPPPVGLISSYALPLLEGCGSLKKGDLKVIGETAPVPFITVFAGGAIPAEKQARIRAALLALKARPDMLKALESKDGFVPLPPAAAAAAPGGDWPDWRGAERDGRVPGLPETLPAVARVRWSQPVMNGGLAGVAVAAGRGLVADRDPTDENDVFRCLRAEDGELIWRLAYPVAGSLDYGQFPRATPVIHQGLVYCLGAFGDLRGVNLADGAVVWKKHLVKDLGGARPKWGYCSTPLIVGDWLIVNPGGPAASLVALDRRTGEPRWKTPGQPAAYASFICATFGGRRQIVGYDEKSLGGWDPQTGARLWTLRPPRPGDFNVPTPVAVDGKLLVATENNGARLYDFAADGRLIDPPVAVFADLASDTVTPIVAGRRLFGCHQGLYCLDLAGALHSLWFSRDPAFDGHVSFFASADRVLAVTASGELLLLRAGGAQCEILSRLRVADDDSESYASPAFAGGRLYLRSANTLRCLEL